MICDRLLEIRVSDSFFKRLLLTTVYGGGVQYIKRNGEINMKCNNCGTEFESNVCPKCGNIKEKNDVANKQDIISLFFKIVSWVGIFAGILFLFITKFCDNKNVFAYLTAVSDLKKGLCIAGIVLVIIGLVLKTIFLILEIVIGENKGKLKTNGISTLISLIIVVGGIFLFGCASSIKNNGYYWANILIYGFSALEFIVRALLLLFKTKLGKLNEIIYILCAWLIIAYAVSFIVLCTIF